MKTNKFGWEEYFCSREEIVIYYNNIKSTLDKETSSVWNIDIIHCDIDDTYDASLNFKNLNIYYSFGKWWCYITGVERDISGNSPIEALHNLHNYIKIKTEYLSELYNNSKENSL